MLMTMMKMVVMLMMMLMVSDDDDDAAAADDDDDDDEDDHDEGHEDDHVYGNGARTRPCVIGVQFCADMKMCMMQIAHPGSFLRAVR